MTRKRARELLENIEAGAMYLSPPHPSITPHEVNAIFDFMHKNKRIRTFFDALKTIAGETENEK